MSLENPELRAFAKDDPNRFLREYGNASGMIIDEFQYVPLHFNWNVARQYGDEFRAGFPPAAQIVVSARQFQPNTRQVWVLRQDSAENDRRGARLAALEQPKPPEKRLLNPPSAGSR